MAKIITTFSLRLPALQPICDKLPASVGSLDHALLDGETIKLEKVYTKTKHNLRHSVPFECPSLDTAESGD